MTGTRRGSTESLFELEMIIAVGAVSVPLDVEAKLPNQTHKTNDGKGLIVGIDVFHQLHCLVS